jgi:hypothetical protein
MRDMQTLNRKVIAAFAIFLLVASVGSLYAGAVLSANSQAAYNFAQTKGYYLNYAPQAQANPTDTSSGYVAQVSAWHLEYLVEIHYAPSGHGYFVNQTLLNQGFTADCLSWCFNGINYFMDPTTIITNQGRGIEQCLVFGATSTDTCTASNFPKVMGWSSLLQGGQTVNATDTWAGTHQSCSTAGGANYLIVDGNGLADAAGTVTPGANGATVTTTIAKTFSITGTYTNVQVACLLSALHGGTNPLIYAESTFGPDTFASGDSLTGTWSIART